MKLPEVLAPAGSMETLCAALRTGADAVYIGGEKYSARSSAENFSAEELAKASRLCHKYGAKLYLAVNTVITDEEAFDFCEYIKYAASIGIDAFIVQDWGAAELIRSCVPDAVLHASTQMSVHTASGARLLKELGYTRVVPARELSRETIEAICSVGIETEVFVHGALCMSVSGQCYMSAMIGSRSANRGKCGQACRLPFSAVGKKDVCALSLKDLSLLPKISELTETGVDSLKIEGRMKRPEYCASAVNELKKALSGEAPDMALLKGVFSRGGFTDGYFSDDRSNMFGIREKEDVVAAQKLIPSIHSLYRFERKCFDADFHAVIRENQPVSITAQCGKCSVTVESEPPEKALNRPTDLDMLKKQLSKLGDTVFNTGEITAEIDDGLIVAAGRLNSIRRELAERLTELIIQGNTPEYTITDYTPVLPEASPQTTDKPQMRTFCRNIAQAKAAAELSEYIILPEELINQNVIDEIGAEKLIASPPRFITDENRLISRLEELKSLGVTRLRCHTPDCIAIGRQLGFTLHGSFSLNAFNSWSIRALHEAGLEDCVVSFEAKASQISTMKSDIPIGAVIYGRPPLMLTRNCPIKNEVGCKNCTHRLVDRTGREFPVLCGRDYIEILNSDCIAMTEKLSDFPNVSFLEVMLLDESAEQTRLLLSGQAFSGSGYTRGLYYRGIY